jgi:hypothetical protein
MSMGGVINSVHFIFSPFPMPEPELPETSEPELPEAAEHEHDHSHEHGEASGVLKVK